MTAAELITELVDWKLGLLAIFVYAVCPQWILRLLVRAYGRDDPRRYELLGEVYAVPYVRRPFWVAEQVETALADAAMPRLRWAIQGALEGRVINRWRLGDGEQRHQEYPQSFWVPDAEEKAWIEPGDLVKLMFEQTWPGGIGERMWVRVTKVGPRNLEGRLDNHPVVIPRLEADSVIRFERRHVIDLAFDTGEAFEVIEAEADRPQVHCPDCGHCCNQRGPEPEHELFAPLPKGHRPDPGNH